MTSPPDLRIHPEDPNVREITVDEVRALLRQSNGLLSTPTICCGCPHHSKRPEVESMRRYYCAAGEPTCQEGTVWYGQHIHMANIMENKV